jgi:hypothetical protein
MQARQHMKKISRAATLAACVVAVAAPAGHAMTNGPGGDVLSRYAANHFVTDTLASGGGDVLSRYVANRGLDSPSAGGGVSWREVAVGLSTGVVLVGLVLTARVLLLRRRVLAR